MALAMPVSANRYAATVDVANWKVESSIFMCRMTHDLPYYGKAIFEQRAGDELAFSLQNIRSQLREGVADLVIEGPEWQSRKAPQALGRVHVEAGNLPIALNGSLSRRLLLALHEGMQPLFKSVAEQGGVLQVAVSPVNFQPAFRQYNQCLEQLLPVNFEQVSTTTVNFSLQKNELSDTVKHQLDAVVLYMKNDASVQSLLVDGHTDNASLSSESMAISERRAKDVTAYLVKAGIKAEQIVTRWHGERYPVASNASLKGRIANRRVTVRLSHDTAKQLVDSEQAALRAEAQEKADKQDKQDAAEQGTGTTPVTDAIKLPPIAPAAPESWERNP